MNSPSPIWFISLLLFRSKNGLYLSIGFCFLLAGYSSVKQMTLYMDGQQVTATVYDYQQKISRLGRVNNPLLRFSTVDSVIIETENLSSFKYYPYQINQKVNVLYNVETPKIAAIKDFTTLLDNALIWLIIAVLLIFLTQVKWLDRHYWTE